MQSLEQQVFVDEDVVFAQRDDERRQTARRHEHGTVTELLLHAVDHAVDHGRGAVHDAAAHAVHGILADHLSGRVETDARQLRRVFNVVSVSAIFFVPPVTNLPQTSETVFPDAPELTCRRQKHMM